MIDLAESDFCALDSFALRARFSDLDGVDPSPELHLRLRPLSARRATELASIAANVRSATGAGTVTFRSDDQPAVVTNRLRELPPRPDDQIVVSWNATTAALTDWKLFTARWDRFCHAAADDLVVWPVAGTWHLCYRRYDVFQFQG